MGCGMAQQGGEGILGLVQCQFFIRRFLRLNQDIAWMYTLFFDIICLLNNRTYAVVNKRLDREGRETGANNAKDA
jgi:hypothetical protein